MEDLKTLLQRCEEYLQKEDWDGLIDLLGKVGEEHIRGLDLNTARECLDLLERLIREGEERRNRVAEALINIKKLKEGYKA